VATVFTRIIQGELPGRFVWRDDRCVAFLSIAPLKPGHVLVVPIAEVGHWIDLEPHLWAHLTEVSRVLGAALHREFASEKVGLMLAGLEVEHVHIHVVPISAEHDLDFAGADHDPDPQAMDEVAARIRTSLRAIGAEHVAD